MKLDISYKVQNWKQYDDKVVWTIAEQLRDINIKASRDLGRSAGKIGDCFIKFSDARRNQREAAQRPYGREHFESKLQGCRWMLYVALLNK